MTIRNNKSNQTAIPINPELVWDYDIPADAQWNEAFRRWYIARVLSRGRAQDLKDIGLETIYLYFPNLNLPAEIHRFWDWYLNLPEVRQRYEDTHASTTPDAHGNWSDATEQ